MYPPSDLIDVLVLIVQSIVDALIQEANMNLLNVITTLNEIKNNLDTIYKNPDDIYVVKLKNETDYDIDNLINDLKAIHRERRGLEINAWRV